MKGARLRARLVPVLETFTGLMMLTLTVDPQLFPSPRDAYFHVRDRRGISNLMRHLDRRGCLHSRRYVYVVEFQHATEQAHFHVLVDASYIPKHEMDVAWSKLRPATAGPVDPNRPAFGMTRFSVSRFEGGPVHAARYATKYLVKVPDAGFPAWVIAMGAKHRVPRFQSSRGLWNNPPAVPSSARIPRDAAPRTYAQRLRDCGTASDVFEADDRIDRTSGEVIPHRRWLARTDVTRNELDPFRTAPRGRVRAKLRAPTAAAAVAGLGDTLGRSPRVISGRLATKEDRA